MKIRFLLWAGVLLATASLSAAETFTIDPAHSSIDFKIRHLFSNVTGRFLEVNGKIEMDEQNPEKSTVAASISAKSITTANEKRDAHLRSPDFFDVEKFATITFQSKSVHALDAKTADVLGDLTIHGVTKAVTLHVTFLGQGQGMMGENAGWEATTTIKRSDFGLTWSKVVEGVAVVGDEVAIDLQISADHK